jgi:HK97 family phage major capsid protein
MRTVEEVLKDLRGLMAQAKAGQDVTAERQRLEGELGTHGIRVAGGTPAPAHPGGSRFATRQVPSAEQVAAGLRDGSMQAANKSGQRGTVSPVSLLLDIQSAKAGDPGAHRRLEALSRPTSKDITGGGYLIADEVIPGYLEARDSAGPIRKLATEHDVKGRTVRMLLEGDDLLVTEHVPEGGTKPDSDAEVIQTVSTVHKAAGVTSLPDELVEDSGGYAEQMISGNFGRSIGKTVDVALLDGTGVGQPLGILRTPDVDATAVAGQTAMDIYTAIVQATYRLTGRYYDNLAVALHPQVLERFDLALDANDNFLFPDGLQGKLGSKARVVEAPNLPVAVGGAVPIIVGAFKVGLHVFSRKGLVIEQSQDAGFVEDTTWFRAVERYGAAVAKPSAFEVLTGTDITSPFGP